MKCPAVGPRRRCRSFSTPAAGRICGLPTCARRLGGFCVTPRTSHERPRRTPYNPHIIFEVSGIPGTRCLVDREDIQRIAARNLGGEYSLLGVKERRRSSWAASWLSSS
jgi:hypothetical protein